MTQPPLSGPQYLKRGFSLLREPGIRLFVILPILVNVLIFGTLSYLTLDKLGQWIGQVMAWLPQWLSFLEWLLWPLAVILVLVIVMYVFSTVANLIAAPFNGLLSEKVEEMLTGEEVAGRETILQAIASFPRSIGRECHKLLYYLGFAIVTLIASFVISPLSPLLWFSLNAWMMALESLDYPMAHRGMAFIASRPPHRPPRLSAPPAPPPRSADDSTRPHQSDHPSTHSHCV